MKEHDLQVRARLAEDGSLYDGYHPEMEAVHRSNAGKLTEIIEEFGWPGWSLVGEDGAEAAWLVVQHAIGLPAFQRRCLALLREALEAGEVPAWQPAYLDDRIRVFEGRKQIYGTQFDVGPDGEPVPYPIEDAERVNERRSALGLPPLDTHRVSIERAPSMDADAYARRQADYQAWLRKVGWRT